MPFFSIFGPKPSPPPPLPPVEESVIRRVDVSKLDDRQTTEVAERLNDEGWLVAIDATTALRGGGYWRGLVVNDHEDDPRPAPHYLCRERTLFLSAAPADIDARVKRTRYIGSFKNYPLVAFPERLALGTISIPAKDAVDLAVAILRRYGALPEPHEALRQRDRLAAEVAILRQEFAARQAQAHGGCAPGEEDGPWAEGWAVRAGLLPPEEAV